MNESQLEKLRLRASARRRPAGTLWAIFTGVAAVIGVALYLYRPWNPETIRPAGSMLKPFKPATNSTAESIANLSNSTAYIRTPAPRPTNSILTVSGYIVNHERIELSPRFMGLVKWIGVKKGDCVTNGQVVARLDDSEYQVRLRETSARLENAKVALAKAELDYQRTLTLVTNSAEGQKSLDDARLQLESARVTVKEVESQLELIKTYLDWTIIRSPINGVVLEKLVDANEMVTPQSFGARGISTALLAVADPQDLQVEIDLNEADIAKVYLNQQCKISPEAYPDRIYDGYVAEISPEASRQKGTLQIKVQILKPDKYLTPELSARVDFLK